MSGQQYNRAKDGIRLDIRGINTVAPLDRMPEGKYPYLQNVRAYKREAATSRSILSAALTTLGFAVHSVRRLNDSTPLGPASGYALILGAGNYLYVWDGTTLTTFAFALSGDQGISMVPFRPNASPQPWMYIGDEGTAYRRKVNADAQIFAIGIKEPQGAFTSMNANAGGNLTGQYSWRYVYRASATGAISNPSSPTPSGLTTLAAESETLVAIPSTDPQVDLIDFYRQGGGLLDFTYVGTAPNSSPTFTDNLTDISVANNPLLQFDNYEPFPSIDMPAKGVVNVTSLGPGLSQLAWVSGTLFNSRWLPGSLVVINGIAYEVWVRPSSATILYVSGDVPVGTNQTYQIQEPSLAAQGLPSLWGPTDNAAFMFACGDPLRPGVLYWTKGNNPDSAPDTNQQDITSPSEPLMNGVIIGGLGMVFSTERAWLIYPNFSSAIATATGVQGSTWTFIEAIADRGLYARRGICSDGGANVYFVARDGIYVSPGGSGSKSITDDIYNLFPHENFIPAPITVGAYTLYPPDYSKPEYMSLSFASGYLYFDYQDVNSTRRTLVYDVLAGGWIVDVYSTATLIHENQEGYEQDTVLVGCADHTVRVLAPSGVEAVSAVVLTQCFNGGEGRADKFFGDIYVDALVGTGSSVAVQGYYNLLEHTVSLSPASLVPASPPVRSQYILDFPGDVGLYARDVACAFTWTLNPAIGLYIWQPALVDVPEFILNRPSDWDDGGNTQAKFLQGVLIEADSANAVKAFLAQSGDDLTTHAVNEVAQFNGRSVKALSFATPFVAHTMRIISADAVDWRIWGIRWVFEPYPELCENWQTEGTSHGLKGWQHIREVNIAHVSTVDLVLTLTPDYGPPIVLTVPNSGGIQTKTKITVTGPNKFKILSYQLACATAFRVFEKDCEVKVKAWGDTGSYQLVRPFGGISNEGAIV